MDTWYYVFNIAIVTDELQSQMGLSSVFQIVFISL